MDLVLFDVWFTVLEAIDSHGPGNRATTVRAWSEENAKTVALAQYDIRPEGNARVRFLSVVPILRGE